MEKFAALEVTNENLRECLDEDVIFVQFFNSFLALAAFPKQLTYNISNGCFEEFHNSLADDVNGEGNIKEAATLKQRFDYFKTTIGERNTRIGYYAKVLEKEAGFEWVKANRLPLFLGSELYSDYNLTKHLAGAQVPFLKDLLSEQLSRQPDSNDSSEISQTHQQALLDLKLKLAEIKSNSYWQNIMREQASSFVAITCEDAHIYQSLWYTDLTRKEKALDDGQFTLELLSVFSESFPVNLMYKQGVDAFKEFLCETPGEKNLLLWQMLERCKNIGDEEKEGVSKHIKERFLKSGSPFEFSKDTLKSWCVDDLSNINLQQLQEKQSCILEPILKYWCQRFTMHQYKLKVEFVKEDLQFPLEEKYKNGPSSNNLNSDHLPLRPLSCASHIRAASHVENANRIDTDMPMPCTEDLSFETGITRRKMRTKSAYPRIISSKLPKSTNAGHKQLQLMSTFTHEGYGFKPQSVKYYQNDACSNEDKKSVRLYIQPVPPVNANASTIQNTMVSKDDDMEESLELSKDLDSLVDMLLHEHHSGNFFSAYLQSQTHKIWLDSYEFWKSVQQYNEYFFANSFHQSVVSRKASLIYSTFIGRRTSCDIQCPDDLREKIHKRLDPPYEDLFDEVEQYALTILIQPWLTLIMKENQQYGSLATEDQLRYIEINRTERISHLVDEDDFNGESELEEDEEEDKIAPEEVERPLPMNKDGLNFDALIRNKQEMEHFQTFLESRHKQGMLDLTAWTDMEVFRRMPRNGTDDQLESRDKKAMEIREKWLSKNYFFGPNTPGSKSAIKKVLDSGGNVKALPKRPASPSIVEAQKYSRARVERRWLLLFKETKEYIERKKHRSSVTELVEDLLMKKKIQRSEHAWRLLNSRWNSSSREVAGLRMALSNEEECQQFRQFIRFRGDMMENNLNFWLEVQKYKDLCHSHVHDTLIRNKVQTIVEVFIKSVVPPELQIDIPIEISERLLEKAFGKSPQHGPYLFREAQTTVFRIMFNFWKDFLAFRSQATVHGSLKEALDELAQQYKHDISKKKLIAERRRLAKLVAEKRKKELLSVEKEKNKFQDLFSVMANTMQEPENTVIDYDVTSFLYSNHQAEGELKLVEHKLLEQGICLDEADRKSVSAWSQAIRNNRSTADKSERNQGGDVVPSSGRRMSFFNTNGAMEMRRLSLGIAYNKEEQRKAVRDLAFNDAKSSRTVKTRASKHDTAGSFLFRSGKSIVGGRAGGLSPVRRYNPMEELRHVGKQKNTSKGRKLTRKSLLEFEKSSQGKPLKQKMVSLPYVNSLDSNNYVSRQAEPPKSSNVKVKPLYSRRLPRNAGTASIIERQVKEALRIESPPPLIEAEVVVC